MMLRRHVALSHTPKDLSLHNSHCICVGHREKKKNQKTKACIIIIIHKNRMKSQTSENNGTFLTCGVTSSQDFKSITKQMDE